MTSNGVPATSHPPGGRTGAAPGKGHGARQVAFDLSQEQKPTQSKKKPSQSPRNSAPAPSNPQNGVPKSPRSSSKGRLRPNSRLSKLARQVKTLSQLLKAIREKADSNPELSKPVLKLIPKLVKRLQQRLDAIPSLIPRPKATSQYLRREARYRSALRSQQLRAHNLLVDLVKEAKYWEHWRQLNRTDPGWIYGQGFVGYGNGWSARTGGPKLIPPVHRRHPGNRRTDELRISKAARSAQAEELEELVPIRLDIELGKLRLRDTFTWNLYDHTVRPELFAEGLVEDFKIPPESTHSFAQQVFQNIHEQIQDFHPHPFIEEEPLDPHLPYSAYKNDEMRILIKLNITIGRHNLTDQFDWDINNKDNSPEEFASRMAYDLCLSGEFSTAIAHSIREQTQMYTKSLYMAGHPFDGRPVENFDIRDNLLSSPLTTVFRPYQSAKDFAPYFFELKDAALDRAEDAFEREQRQQKRSVNRKGGPTLPDLKERLRTVRTLLVSDHVPGASENLDDCGIYKPTRTAIGRGRRSYRADRGEESDMSETGDSDGDSPSRKHALQGTARTRGMRGAASAAQAAMRANLVDSLDDQFESRSSRRAGDSEPREASVSEPSHILRLKISRDKYRRWYQQYEASKVAAQRAKLQEQQRRQAIQQGRFMQQQHQQQYEAQRAAAAQHQQSVFQSGTPPQFNMRAPSHLSQVHNMHPQTPQQHQPFNRPPSAQHQHQPPPPQQQQQQHHHNGPSPTPPRMTMSQQGQNLPPQPPPPPWLETALSDLRAERASTNPGLSENFTAVMRWNPEERTYQPRIRCTDCQNGILYRTEEHDPVRNFRTHLGTKEHREKSAAKLSTQ